MALDIFGGSSGGGEYSSLGSGAGGLDEATEVEEEEEGRKGGVSWAWPDSLERKTRKCVQICIFFVIYRKGPFCQSKYLAKVRFIKSCVFINFVLKSEHFSQKANIFLPRTKLKCVFRECVTFLY